MHIFQDAVKFFNQYTVVQNGTVIAWLVAAFMVGGYAGMYRAYVLLKRANTDHARK